MRNKKIENWNLQSTIEDENIVLYSIPAFRIQQELIIVSLIHLEVLESVIP